MRRLIAISLLAVFGTALAAQQPARKFELVSLRALPPDSPPIMREQNFTAVLPAGRYIDPSTNLFFLIAFAYDVTNPDSRLLALPAWKGKASALSARAADGFPELSPDENREQVRLMVRGLLEDRFP